jgi:hypothetical protein
VSPESAKDMGCYADIGLSFTAYIKHEQPPYTESGTCCVRFEWREWQDRIESCRYSVGICLEDHLPYAMHAFG